MTPDEALAILTTVLRTAVAGDVTADELLDALAEPIADRVALAFMERLAAIDAEQSTESV